MTRDQLIAQLRDSAEAALDAWDEYDRGSLGRLIVQARMREMSDVLGEIERDESLGGTWPTGFS